MQIDPNQMAQMSEEQIQQMQMQIQQQQKQEQMMMDGAAAAGMQIDLSQMTPE